ncbi:MAG: dienelactone hydrolase family protein, partial [Psychromonas sp.]
YEQDLKALAINYVAYTYPKVNHGFHNDSTARYDKENAELAWQRSIDFFNKYLV